MRQQLDGSLNRSNGTLSCDSDHPLTVMSIGPNLPAAFAIQVIEIRTPSRFKPFLPGASLIELTPLVSRLAGPPHPVVGQSRGSAVPVLEHAQRRC